ncbi:hypothetical protein ElyMa_002540300 [Elysia marginata]|uniref:Uncharacterized protein n=1 Tax=Elysia marginata TaxID=1093978 RepID=A0AAV4GUE0_9GAST|nr:hypothetical protein ElyMa_002540300 [Elysia marginata]
MSQVHLVACLDQQLEECDDATLTGRLNDFYTRFDQDNTIFSPAPLPCDGDQPFVIAEDDWQTRGQGCRTRRD